MPLSIARRIAQRVIRLYSLRANIHVGRRVHIGLGSVIWAPSNLVIGDDVYIGKGCTIEVDGSIGRGCLIANRVGLVGRYDHDFKEIGVRVRDAPWVGDLRPEELGPRHSITIGEDCWIGYGAVVLSGCRVGRGSIVAAGAVVTKDVPEYCIVAGNPGVVVGNRFTEAERLRHEAALAARR